jgi:hypothetical protein
MLSELFHQLFSDNWVMQQQVGYGFDSFLVNSDTLDKIHFVLYKKTMTTFYDMGIVPSDDAYEVRLVCCDMCLFPEVLWWLINHQFPTTGLIQSFCSENIVPSGVGYTKHRFSSVYFENILIYIFYRQNTFPGIYCRNCTYQ